MNKLKKISKLLLWALMSTPVAWFICVIVLIFSDIVEWGRVYAIRNNFGWIQFVPAFVLALLYWIYEPKYKAKREMKKLTDALILYLKCELEKQNLPVPHEGVIEQIRPFIGDRIAVWMWQDKDLWNEHFKEASFPQMSPVGDPYPNSLFEIIDNLLLDERFQCYLKDDVDALLQPLSKENHGE